MQSTKTQSFASGFASWNNSVANSSIVDWTEQLRILNDIADLITPEHTVEEITAIIYSNVNQLFDAFQLAVGIYNEEEGTLTYKGMIENGKQIPEFSVDAIDENRFASWCIRNETEIFMNDIDNDFSKYTKQQPVPLAGSNPKAALYAPLKLNNKIVGVITVRTIRKNMYQQHHLYILKTVGNFVVRALELARNSASGLTASNSQKNWQWCNPQKLPSVSRRALEQLTEREKEVLFLLVTGLSNKSLAERLFISASTVKTHTLSIYQKMDVKNRTSAILKAIELGWVF